MKVECKVTRAGIRPMRDGEEAAVVEMIRALARETGGRAVPALTPETLKSSRDVLDVAVADSDGGGLIGACVSLITFSTWRGARGCYVVDLYVGPAFRGSGAGESLLRFAGQRAWEKGAEFMKLEVDLDNASAARFYDRLGFARNEHDRLFTLERQPMAAFLD